MGKRSRKHERGFGTPATVALERAGIPFQPHTYEHDPAVESYGLEAIAALDVEPERVYKTLLVDCGPGLAVGIVPVADQLDLKSVAFALGVKKVTMAQARDAERATGYVLGGISPVGQKRLLPTLLDDTAATHETIFVSGGHRGFDIELTAQDLLTITRGRVVPIRR